MLRLSRITTLLLACALALALAGPAALAADSSAGEEYVLEVPTGGNGAEAGESAGGSDSGTGGSADRGTVGIAAGSADEGGLPILLVVLAGTAAIGVCIAIMRRRRTT